ncbi:MAG: tRNA uridine-5-carboxymethylaminomethyl(34) synthesis enzyme MnmG, partial [Myxococcaceae bacterium]
MLLDVLVIGGGHAGCEAALCTARLGLKTLMITGSLDRIAAMSCNPAIGGVGKGHLVKEIDALGGEMPRIADLTGIHFRTLNASRGPAVQATRCQSDMERYRRRMTEVIFSTENLSLRQDDVIALVSEGSQITGVRTKHSGEIKARCVIITTGTFMGGQLHLGNEKMPGGRAGEAPTSGLSHSLAQLGLELGRLKTGTCPRLDSRTIDYTSLEEQLPETPAPMFAFESEAPVLKQISCHMTHTNAQTHGVIQDAIASGRAPLYNGQIAGTGPRYCPSIEDKVTRFAQKESHLIFLEPQGLDTYEVYPNGLSTSLPPAVQIDFLRSMKGLEQVEVTRWGYAVEYDFVKPTQLYSTLETKTIQGLYCAGQINGTTGYEEAAIQGLLAGMN